MTGPGRDHRRGSSPPRVLARGGHGFLLFGSLLVAACAGAPPSAPPEAAAPVSPTAKTVLFQPPARADSRFGAALDQEIDAMGLESHGMRWGIAVWIEGRGIVYRRNAHEPRSAASAIKPVIVLDLLQTLSEDLDRVPRGLDTMVGFGAHPAFHGFTPEQLNRCRRELGGKTYLELAHIMMGRTPATNDVYNAACNAIMIKLGGPGAIQDRVAAAFPDGQFDINRYMQTWNGDGDNLATPLGLVNLYRSVADGTVRGLDTRSLFLYRALLQQDWGSPGTVYGKAGTLYPSPMVRVHAGYVRRDAGDLVYAVMGEIPEPVAEDPGELFVRLMSAADAVALVCRDPSFFE